MPDTLPSPILPIQVAVVDEDLLWRAEVMNKCRPLYADDFVVISEAAEYLHPSNPCVMVIRPAGFADSQQALVQARQGHPYLRVVLAGAPEPELPAGRAAAGGIEELGLSSMPASSGPHGETNPIDSVMPADHTIDELVAEVNRLHASATEQADADRDASENGSLRDTQLIVVTGAKAGEGTTVTAVHLAWTLQARGHQVTLVEIDPTFGDVAMRLGLHPRERTAATRSLSLSAETVRHLLCDGPEGMSVFLPPHTKSTFNALPGSAIRMLLDELQPDADFIVVDSPFFQVHQSDLAALADDLLLVTTTGLTNLKNTSVAGALLDRARNVSAVLNRLGGGGRRRFRHEEEPDPRDISNALQLPIVGKLPHTSDLNHVPDKRSDRDFLRAIDQVAEEVIGG